MDSVHVNPVIIQKHNDKCNTAKVVGGLAGIGYGTHLGLKNMPKDYAKEICDTYYGLHDHCHIADDYNLIPEWIKNNTGIVKECIKKAKLHNIANTSAKVAICTAIGIGIGAIVDGIVKHCKNKN